MTLNNTIRAVALLQTIQVVIHVITADYARRQPRVTLLQTMQDVILVVALLQTMQDVTHVITALLQTMQDVIHVRHYCSPAD